MRYVAIIPARAASKGVPGKNLKPISGKPLIAWSIETARSCRCVARTIVSTDGADIAAVAKAHGADVPVLRPAELATDASPTEPALIHAVEHMLQDERQPDAVILLQPTSPLRRPGSLDQAIDLFESRRADSLVSVCETHAFFWKSPEDPQALYDYRHRPRRQDIPAVDRRYRENGSIYITRTELLLRERNRLGGHIAMHVMSEAESWEIDSEVDFRIVETLMQQAAHDH